MKRTGISNKADTQLNGSGATLGWIIRSDFDLHTHIGTLIALTIETHRPFPLASQAACLPPSLSTIEEERVAENPRFASLCQGAPA